MKRIVMTALTLAALAAAAFAAREASVERGKELFESKSLGSNRKSCATCHPDGDKLQSAASYPDQRLAKIVNLCIVSMLKGNPLPTDSNDMASLIQHLKSFAPR